LFVSPLANSKVFSRSLFLGLEGTFQILSFGMQAKKSNPRYKALGWVVERPLSWLNRFRKPLVRFEKKTSSHEALLELAYALIVFRRAIFIYG